MTEKTFLKVIGILKNNYLKFDFEETIERIRVWYEPFKNYDDQTFLNVIKLFCEQQEYPPQSPRSIIKFIEELNSGESMSGIEAWNLAYDTRKNSGYDLIKAVEKLENSHPIVAKTLNDIRNSFNGLLTENLGYVQNAYIKQYEFNLKNHSNSSIKVLELKEKVIKQLGWEVKKC